MSDSAFVMEMSSVVVAGLLMTGLWRFALARRVWRTGSTREFNKVSAYQMALMNGGVARVALTAVVRLVGRKALVPEVAGVLVRSSNVPGALDAFENEAMTLAPALLHDLTGELAAQLRHKGMIAGLRRELAGMGYMRRFASWRWWLAYGLNVLPFALLILAVLTAWTRLAADFDARLDFMILSGAVMLIAGWPTAVTAFGRYIIWSATQHHPDYKTARAREGEALDTKKLSQAVALYGRDALAGSDLAWISALLKHSENSGHSD